MCVSLARSCYQSAPRATLSCSARPRISLQVGGLTRCLTTPSQPLIGREGVDSGDAYPLRKCSCVMNEAGRSPFWGPPDYHSSDLTFIVTTLCDHDCFRGAESFGSPASPLDPPDPVLAPAVRCIPPYCLETLFVLSRSHPCLFCDVHQVLPWDTIIAEQDSWGRGPGRDCLYPAGGTLFF
jgi:hypothetical protein